VAPASTGRHRTGNVVRRVNLRTGLLTTPAGGGLWGLGGDGGLARQAQLALLEGVSVDRSGNLLATDGSSVRVVAAASGAFYGQVMKAGDIYTGAGGGTSLRNGVLAASALLKHPHAVTVDGAGNIVVGDQLATRLRVVAARTGTFYGVPMRAGHVYMIAGNRRTWSSGAAEPSTRAQFFPNWPITFDNGNLVAADSHSTSTSLHTSVRLVPARSGSFFGIAMKAGHLYRIAGDGQEDFSGNGTSARKSGIGQISRQLAARSSASR